MVRVRILRIAAPRVYKRATNIGFLQSSGCRDRQIRLYEHVARSHTEDPAHRILIRGDGLCRRDARMLRGCIRRSPF